MKRVIEIKGTAHGAIIKIAPNASIEEVLASLDEQISSSDFYSKSQFIGTMGRYLTYAEKTQIDELIFEKTGKCSASLEEYDEKKTPSYIEKVTRERVLAEYQQLIDEEIAPKIEKLEQELAVAKEKNALHTGNSIFHEGTLRSGNSIKYDGNVIILGDINAGAEVVAGGNIICIGKTLGMVHAGAGGDENAFIISLNLAPTQIRIARYVSGPAKGSKYKGKGVPEIARLIGEKIVLEEV